MGAVASASAARAFAEATHIARRAAALEVRPLGRLKAQARALALPYAPDEREALALLFLPFLLVASAIVVHQSVRSLASYLVAVARPDLEVAPLGPGAAGRLPLAALPPTPLHEAPAAPALLRSVRAPSANKAVPATPPGGVLGTAPPAGLAAPAALPPSALPTRDAAALAPAAPPAALPAPATKLALLPQAAALGPRVAAVVPAPVESLDADDAGNPLRPGICTVETGPRTAALASAGAASLTLTGEAFGRRLAEAAEAQAGGFVIYNDAYRRIAYPMGDVSGLFGVCTDVVVRAYRALGLDLQALVHQARSGSGDTSIDHRRTEVLRRFFAAHGETLPVTPFAEDYRPGDIVTYYRPQNRGSRAHIAIVSTVVAPSGRPMIVHNRGWGPELEDALFVDEITGHYRYRGPAPTRSAGTARLRPLPASGLPLVPAALAAAEAPRP